MRRYPSDIAFTPAVKQIQVAKGSRAGYARVESGQGWETSVTPELAEFMAGLDMFYFGTANSAGQPYIQYRGGSPGFLKVLDDHTLGFADFGGNRQYITLGNLSENPQAFIFRPHQVRGAMTGWAMVRLTPEGQPSCYKLYSYRSCSGRWHQHSSRRLPAARTPSTRNSRWPMTKLTSKWQEYFRKHQPPVLIVWGKCVTPPASSRFQGFSARELETAPRARSTRNNK